MKIMRVICSNRSGEVYSVRKDLKFIKRLRDRADIDVIYIDFFSYKNFKEKNSNFKEWDLAEVLENEKCLVGVFYSKLTGMVCCVDGSHTYKADYWDGKDETSSLGVVYLNGVDYNEMVRADFHVVNWRVIEDNGNKFIKSNSVVHQGFWSRAKAEEYGHL